MNDRFGVRVSGEFMAARFQILAQLGIIVNFAVEHHPELAVFIRERLMPAGQIDDAQAAETQAQASVDENAFIIRAAMNDGFVHPMDELLRDGLVPLVFENAADSAHGLRANLFQRTFANREIAIEMAISGEHFIQTEIFEYAAASGGAVIAAQLFIGRQNLELRR